MKCIHHIYNSHTQRSAALCSSLPQVLAAQHSWLLGLDIHFDDMSQLGAQQVTLLLLLLLLPLLVGLVPQAALAKLRWPSCCSMH
jgi:hypothetical protein